MKNGEIIHHLKEKREMNSKNQNCWIKDNIVRLKKDELYKI